MVWRWYVVYGCVSLLIRNGAFAYIKPNSNNVTQ